MRKIKYTEEIKLQIVEEVLKNKRSKKWLSKETGIDATTIRKWVRAYEENGLAGLKIRQNNHSKYDGDFKLMVVKYKLENKISSKQAAAYFNIAIKQNCIGMGEKVQKRRSRCSFQREKRPKR